MEWCRDFLKSSFMAVVILVTLASAGSSASAGAKTATPLQEPQPQFTSDQIPGLLIRLQREQKLCRLPPSKRPLFCRQEKFLLAMESVMQSYIELQKKLETLSSRVVYLDEENLDLKSAMKAERQPSNYVEPKTCYKPDLLRRIMLDNGITENGSSTFVKLPIPGNAGVCWSNSKKKQEASFSLCNFPLAIDVRTKGGSDLYPTIKEREYVFSLNKCDLLSVHIKEQDMKKTTETYVSYNQCLEQWNKRTADASMNPTEVKLMEDTIGVCFREHLLPPRNVKNGRDNPARPLPTPNQDSKTGEADPKG